MKEMAKKDYVFFEAADKEPFGAHKGAYIEKDPTPDSHLSQELDLFSPFRRPLPVTFPVSVY